MKENLVWLEYCKIFVFVVVEICVKVLVSSGLGVLVKVFGLVLFEWKFWYVMSWGGWYWLGGIFDFKG